MNLYTKYSQNTNITISYDEILNDFRQIKPTFNPILDICIIKKLGSYITDKIHYQQWQICPDLADEICMIHVDMIDIDNIMILDIIKNASSKHKPPSHTINQILYFVSDAIKANINTINSNITVSTYFDIKSKYNNSLDQIKIKYTDSWTDIEKQYENISNIIIENFSELENDVNFKVTTDLIDTIGHEANKKIELLIKQFAILIKENNQLISQIKIDFDKQMDEIYEQVVSSKKFDKVIHDIMIDMFGVEKEIHRMSLSLENCINVVQTIRNS